MPRSTPRVGAVPPLQREAKFGAPVFGRPLLWRARRGASEDPHLKFEVIVKQLAATKGNGGRVHEIIKLSMVLVCGKIAPKANRCGPGVGP